MIENARGGDADSLAILSEAPPIAPGSKFYWSIYQDIGSDRPPAMQGMSRIPFTALRAYADEYGIHGKMREALFHVIRNVDVAHCAMIAERSERENRKKK